VALKIAVFAVALTLTEAGTVRDELLLETMTVVPPLGAGWFRVSVQVVVPPELTLVELQPRPVTSIGTTRVKVVACVLPFKLPVIVASWVLVSVPTVAVKLAVVDPADTVTEAGVVKAELLTAKATLVPPVGAAWFRVTVQELVPPELTLVGLQPRPVTIMGATKVKVVVCELLLELPVIVAVWVLVSVPTVAVKLAVVEPGGTVTEAGMVKAELLIARATLVPPAGAAWFIVMAQLVVPPELTLVGLQPRPVTIMGATKVKVVVCELPFKLPVIMAVWVPVSMPSVAVKVAVVVPAPTLTLAGITKAGLLLARATLVPPTGAAWFRVTVHVVLPLELTLVGLQAKTEIMAGVPIKPPLAAIWSALPDGEALDALVMAMEVPIVALDSVTVATATTPSGIVFWFIPVSKQEYEPEPATHEIDLPAAVAAAPALAEIATMAEGEYVNVHSRPAGEFPAEANERLSETV
jgi:hypothetical protein